VSAVSRVVTARRSAARGARREQRVLLPIRSLEARPRQDHACYDLSWYRGARRLPELENAWSLIGT